MIHPYIKLSYGELLHLFRRRRKLSFKKLSEEVDISKKSLMQYESKMIWPSYRNYVKLAEFYGDEFTKLANYLTEAKFAPKKSNNRRILTFREPDMIFSGDISQIKRRRVSEKMIIRILYSHAM